MGYQTSRVALGAITLSGVPPPSINLLPVPSPGPQGPGQPLVAARPGFPLNGGRNVEFEIQVNSASVALGDSYFHFYSFDGTESTDGINRGGFPVGSPVRFTLNNVTSQWIQFRVDKWTNPTVIDFVRVAVSQ